MRTTLTLEPDIAERLQQEIRRSGKQMKAIINDALRRGLGLRERHVAPPVFKVEAHDFGFKPGTDLNRMNQLADELEAEEFSHKLTRR